MEKPVLVCLDDEQSILNSLKRVLRKEKFRVLTTTDPETALQYIRDEDVHVVISDYKMPLMTGLEFLQKVQAFDDEIIRVVLSGYADTDAIITAINENQLYRYLVKPWKEQDLIMDINHCFDRYHDIKENKRLNQIVAQERKQLDAIMASMSDLLIVTDNDFVITFANKLAKNFFALQAFGQQKIHSVFAVHEQFDDLIRDMDGYKLKKQKVFVMNKQGEMVPALISSDRLALEADHVASGYVFCIQDISFIVDQEKKTEKLKEELFQSAKFNSLGYFAGGIAHEFNNMMQTIRGYSDLMRDLYQNDEKIQNYTQVIQEATQKGSNLTAGILAYAKQGQYYFEYLSLSDIVENTRVILKTNKLDKVKIEYKLSHENKEIVGDKAQLMQVILNLIKNASAACRDNGRIEITTDSLLIKEPVELNTRLLNPGEYVFLSVKDNGCGIADDHLQYIFDPFFTTSEVGQGIGLGLSMVMGCMKQHNGFIDIESSVNVGTKVDLYFPIIHEDEKQTLFNQNNTAIKARRLLENCHVLVVDDEASILEMTKQSLLHNKAEPYAVDSGTEAIAYYREHHEQIDMVLLDVMMPDINGVETCREMLRINPSVNVLFISGYDETDEMKGLCQENQNINFIRKPCMMSQVIAFLSTQNMSS